MTQATESCAAWRAVVVAGVALRVVLFALPTVHDTLSSRPELVTAVSAFRRVKEAAFLFNSVGTPYAGDAFHQPPLAFAFFYPIFLLPESFQYFATCALFIAVDVSIAYGLARLCQLTHQREESNVKDQDVWISKTPVSPIFAPQYLSAAVAAIYLFNPYTLASTIAMATTTLTHLTVLYAFVFASEGAVAAAMLCLSVATYLSVYPVTVIVPVVLLLNGNTPAASRTTRAFTAVGLFVFWLAALIFVSNSLAGGWEYLMDTYGWVALYSDLTPNVGIFWYFFIEVFDRFIPYFLLVLHVHPLIYIAPLYLRLSQRPQVYATIMFGIASLFQAYPSFGDFGFFLALISIHPKSIATITNRFVYAIGLAVPTIMMPVMWFLWLFPASGNANFFYNQTLVYQIFNCQFMNAFVGATMKRDKDVQLCHKRLAADAAKPKTE